MQEKIASAKKAKIQYTKPVVLAQTKSGNNFSAGCPTKSGWGCRSCRCS